MRHKLLAGPYQGNRQPATPRRLPLPITSFANKHPEREIVWTGWKRLGEGRRAAICCLSLGEFG